MHDAGAPQGPVLLAEDGVGPARVDVLDDARDLGALLAQGGHHAVGSAQLGNVGHQREQHVVGGIAAAHHRVAKDADAAVLLIGGNVQALGNACHAVEDLAGAGVLDQALLAGNDAVGACGVEAAADASVAGGGKGRGSLVAVGQGLAGDAADLVDARAAAGGHVSQKGFDLLLLASQLDGVGHAQPLAASAVARDLACVGAKAHVNPLVDVVRSSIHGHERLRASSERGRTRSTICRGVRNFDSKTKIIVEKGNKE